jgi:hypothetical protein
MQSKHSLFIDSTITACYVFPAHHLLLSLPATANTTVALNTAIACIRCVLCHSTAYYNTTVCRRCHCCCVVVLLLYVVVPALLVPQQCYYH